MFLELLFSLESVDDMDSIEVERFIPTVFFGIGVSGFELLFGLLMALANNFPVSETSKGSTTTLKSLNGKELACSSIVHFFKRRQ